MAEPTSTALLASVGAFTSAMGFLAASMGVPPPVVMAAILGAATAVGASDRAVMSARSVFAMAMTFCMSLGLGIWAGSKLAGPVLVALLNSLPGLSLHLADDAANPLCTAILAAIGQRELLPLGLAFLRSKAGGA
ncbi:hypothetical protein DEH84_07100 [Aquabacterium olei]|uniref:Uncharacterized protein n=1 Tax=Aquabacterium olei TaxID=1296669 RepID=A0A2U8FQD0_9BURK|nr:hypothetical protein [Aquabacterium olei]AWI53223.1 hypothetical protein DEH84_07100 [Aquabacterium olei]